MNNRNAALDALISDEKIYQRLISEEWNKKISIYADMLFLMDPSDFIDFMTGCMAYMPGVTAFMMAATPPDSSVFVNVCMDPTILAHDAMKFAGAAMFFGALHMLYRYEFYSKYDLERASSSIEYCTERKLNATNRRYTLFPESNKSYVSSAVESARKLIGI